jgi:hypothetical protein
LERQLRVVFGLAAMAPAAASRPIESALGSKGLSKVDMAARSSVVPATRTGVGPRISNGRANPQVWRGGGFSRAAGASRVEAAIGAPVC